MWALVSNDSSLALRQFSEVDDNVFFPLTSVFESHFVSTSGALVPPDTTLVVGQ